MFNQTTTDSIFSYDGFNRLNTKLSGSNWTLKPVGEEDIEFYQDLFANPEIMKHFGDGSVRDREATKKRVEESWIQRFKDGQPHGAMLISNNARERIGHIVAGGGDGSGVSELAYAYVPEVWGQGIGTAVVKAVVEVWAPEVRKIGMGHAEGIFATPEVIRCFKCFENEALSRIDATTSPTNIASVKILDKNGFKAAQYKLNAQIACLDYEGKELEAEEIKQELMGNDEIPSGIRVSMIDTQGIMRTLSKHEGYNQLKYHLEREVL